jgi:hypothetical protein
VTKAKKETKEKKKQKKKRKKRKKEKKEKKETKEKNKRKKRAAGGCRATLSERGKAALGSLPLSCCLRRYIRSCCSSRLSCEHHAGIGHRRL